MRPVCKTAAASYVGSNPTPATVQKPRSTPVWLGTIPPECATVGRPVASGLLPGVCSWSEKCRVGRRRCGWDRRGVYAAKFGVPRGMRRVRARSSAGSGTPAFTRACLSGTTIHTGGPRTVITAPPSIRPPPAPVVTWAASPNDRVRSSNHPPALLELVRHCIPPLEDRIVMLGEVGVLIDDLELEDEAVDPPNVVVPS
jgi:hypothetical protein